MKQFSEEYLRKKLLFHIFLNILLIALFAILAIAYGVNFIKQSGVAARFVSKKDVPFRKEVIKIIKPLGYSGLNRLLREGVEISVDFADKKWVLHNIYKYGENGEIKLEDENFGLCESLAVYVYQKIRPVFPEKKYDITFVKVSESSFFYAPTGTHYVLMITDLSVAPGSGPGEYILDPSFKKYDRIEAFDEYLFNEHYETLPFFEKKLTYQKTDIGHQMPILIRKGYLVGLFVDKINGKLDNDNYVLALIATKKHKYYGRLIFAIRNINGQVQNHEDSYLASSIFKKSEYERLKSKIIEMFEGI
jgi:hypothetical protein